MHDHTKIIAPIAVVLCIVGYYISVGIYILKLPLPAPVKALALLAPAILSCVIVRVAIKRLRETESDNDTH